MLMPMIEDAPLRPSAVGAARCRRCPWATWRAGTRDRARSHRAPPSARHRRAAPPECPDCAARPTWNGLVMEPKLAAMPPAIDAAIADRVGGFAGIEAAHHGGRGGGGNGSEHRARVPALEMILVGIAADQLAPRPRSPPHKPSPSSRRRRRSRRLRQDGRHQDRAWVSAQSHIIIIERMRRGAVEQRGIGRPHIRQQNAVSAQWRADVRADQRWSPVRRGRQASRQRNR